MIITGNEENFKELIDKDLALIVFFAPWCGPCRMLETVLEECANECQDLKIIRINIDENMNLVKEYGIMSVPTLMIIKEKQTIATKNGFIPKEMLINWINEQKV